MVQSKHCTLSSMQKRHLATTDLSQNWKRCTLITQAPLGGDWFCAEREATSLPRRPRCRKIWHRTESYIASHVTSLDKSEPSRHFTDLGDVKTSIIYISSPMHCKKSSNIIHCLLFANYAVCLFLFYCRPIRNRNLSCFLENKQMLSFCFNIPPVPWQRETIE